MLAVRSGTSHDRCWKELFYRACTGAENSLFHVRARSYSWETLFGRLAHPTMFSM